MIAQVGNKVKINLKSHRLHGKTGIVIDTISGLYGCMVLELDDSLKEKTTFNYRYLEVLK